ncbi:MAG: hypothetical protein RLY93_05650 [Sumerlaeia bacterium]
MKTTPSRNRRAVTLLETMIAVFLLTLIVGFTMRSLGQSSVLRARAAQRAELALVAQTELDRLRREPDALTSGTRTLQDPAWTAGTTVAAAAEPQSPGVWRLEVSASRATIEGLAPVRLVTLIPAPEEGGAP